MEENSNEVEKSIEILEKNKLSRKGLLKLAGLGMATAALGSLLKKTAHAAEKEKNVSIFHFGMVIDLQRCVGCKSCTVACKVENNIPVNVEKEGRKIFWNEVAFREEGDYPLVKKKMTNRPCMHCENPPCVKVCPVGASSRNDDGVVLIDHDACIGCRYCAVACPYGARYFNWSKPNWYGALREEALNPDVETRPKGVMEKCVYCIHRIEQAIEAADSERRDINDHDLVNLPACVQTCMGRARFFGNFKDPDSTVSKLVRSGRAFRLLEELGTEPSTFYLY